MKKLIFTLAIGCAMLGCRSDIDLNNIDAKAQVDGGLALPVGSFRITLEDMVGNVDGLYIDSLNHKGVLTWKMDTMIERYYHQVNLAQYLSSKTLEMKVYDKMGDLMDADGKVTTGASPVQFRLDFPLSLKLKGINESGSLSEERIDSALVEVASFASTIKRIGGLPLEWAWIDRVTLDLGKQISRPAGNTMTVYTKGDGYGYTNSIPTPVDNFTIVMMKDRNGKPSNSNVIDTCAFDIHFYFTIPADTSFTVPQSAAFSYKLDVQFIDYKAVWGMFKPSSDMEAEEVVNISDGWGKLDFLTKSKLPFADPVITADIVTKVAGALYIDNAYVFVADKSGNRQYAEFGNNRMPYRQIFFKDDEWLSLSSAIGDSTTNMKVRFDNTPEGGRIHELFREIPKDLGYSFKVRFNTGITPQIRITPNSGIRVNSRATLPFIFNEGVFVNYPDTIKDVNLSQVSIDSLKAQTDVLDTVHTSDLKLILLAQNTIPLHVKAAMRCYDKDGLLIMDPKDPSQPYLLFKSDTITLDPPVFARTQGSTVMVPTQPGETTMIASLTKEEIDLMATIKEIRTQVVIDDEALQEAYKNGLTNVSLMGEQDVTFKIGLTANVNAVLDFNKKNK
ncbi:MAG: hypothetical protein J6M55_01785 [Paludibacteraceae bacterium]|nr:hypothetical protein [Paludibacteraceae bacterium]